MESEVSGARTGGTGGRSRAGSSPAGIVGTGMAVVLGAVVVAVATSSLLAHGLEIVSLVVAGLLAFVVGLAAITRFELFVLMLLVVRSSLDVLGQGDLRGGALDPAAAVGAVFIAAASLWLLMRFLTGDWVKPSAPTKALFALCAAAAMSVFSSPFKVASIEATSRVLAGVLMFAVLEQLLARAPSPRPYLVALFLSAVVPIAVAYQQLLSGTGGSGIDDASRVQGTFAHPNPLASYLVSTMLVAVVLALRGHGRLRRVAVVTLVAAAPVLVFTYTRAAWLGLTVALIYLGLRLDRRILGALAATFVVIVMLSPSVISRITDVTAAEDVYYDGPTNSFEWRIEYWGDVLPLASRSPMTGIGIETTQRVTDDELQPHNTFVQAYVEMGVLGLAALVAVVVAFARDLRRNARLVSTRSESSGAIAAVAVGLAILVQAPSANLLTATVVYWYTALALLHGHRPTVETSSRRSAIRPVAAAQLRARS